MSKLLTSVDVVDAMSGVTMHVDFKRTTEMRWRVWLATKLMSLAAWVLNCGFTLDGDKDGDDKAN